MFNVDKIKKELESRGLDANSFDYLYNYLKSNDLLDKLSDYTNRLLKGEAVQYIIGNVDFYGYEFKVNSNTLIPRFETELLVEKSVNYINNFFEDRVSILDIGTGSGCIAIALNKLVNSMVTAVDISNDALDVAKENNVINNTPHPYIGQYGPIKTPLFTNFFFLIDICTVSITHPANEYIKNNAIYFSISTNIFSPF